MVGVATARSATALSRAESMGVDSRAWRQRLGRLRNRHSDRPSVPTPGLALGALAPGKADLSSSVQMWQCQQAQQQQQQAAQQPLQEAVPAGIASASCGSQPPTGRTSQPAIDDNAVELSSGSLLVWRVPSRPVMGAPPLIPPAGPMAPPPGSILQRLGSFGKKLFGADALASEFADALGSQKQPAAVEEEQRPSSRAGWSIAAVRVPVGPEAAAPAAEERQQPATPSILGKLQQLKLRQQEAAERRRVWSAPAVPAAASADRLAEQQPAAPAPGNPPVVPRQGSAALRPGLQGELLLRCVGD